MACLHLSEVKARSLRHTCSPYYIFFTSHHVPPTITRQKAKRTHNAVLPYFLPTVRSASFVKTHAPRSRSRHPLALGAESFHPVVFEFLLAAGRTLAGKLHLVYFDVHGVLLGPLVWSSSPKMLLLVGGLVALRLGRLFTPLPSTQIEIFWRTEQCGSRRLVTHAQHLTP